MKHFSDALFEETLEKSSTGALDISELCKEINSKLFTFGGNCGSFALALYNTLTKLGHKVELVICSNLDEFKEANWTDEDELEWYLNGEPNIYHVAIRLDGDNDKLYDGDGIATIESLADFCYEYYGDNYATIDCWSIDSVQEYDLFYKIFRYNTNMSIHPNEFETSINDYLNILSK